MTYWAAFAAKKVHIHIYLIVQNMTKDLRIDNLKHSSRLTPIQADGDKLSPYTGVRIKLGKT